VEEFDVHVGVPTTGEGTVLPGGPWATTLHVGPYPQLPLAYTALLEHVREHGHHPVGPVTETYLTDPSTAEPDELVTRVAVALSAEG
jgi:effector-binding domain-containing protein